MKPVLMIGGLAVAAAAGAAACYLLVKPNILPGGSGNGAVVCPGSAACPNESKDTPTKSYYGYAVPHPLVPSRIVMCDGKNNTRPCTKGYVGIVAKVLSSDKLAIKICTDGAAPCDANTDMIYCEVPSNATNPGPCAVYPAPP